MIPQDIIDKLGLVASGAWIGDSFVNEERLYNPPEKIEGYICYVMGCDLKGRTLKDDMMLVYLSKKGRYIQQWVTHECARFTVINIVNLMFRKMVEQYESEIGK